MVAPLDASGLRSAEEVDGIAGDGGESGGHWLSHLARGHMECAAVVVELRREVGTPRVGVEDVERRPIRRPTVHGRADDPVDRFTKSARAEELRIGYGSGLLQHACGEQPPRERLRIRDALYGSSGVPSAKGGHDVQGGPTPEEDELGSPCARRRSRCRHATTIAG